MLTSSNLYNHVLKVYFLFYPACYATYPASAYRIQYFHDLCLVWKFKKHSFAIMESHTDQLGYCLICIDTVSTCQQVRVCKRLHWFSVKNYTGSDYTGCFCSLCIMVFERTFHCK